MNLQPDRTVLDSCLDRLLDDAHAAALFHFPDQFLDVVVEHPNAAMAHFLADTKALVGAMDEVTVLLELKREGAQRIRGSGGITAGSELPAF